MHLRSFRSLALAFASALALFGTSPAHAAAKDKEAEKLLQTAIDTDYLGADFPKAEKHLQEAIKLCGTDKCSSAVVAKLHIALGTVYAVGMSKNDEGKAELVLGLKADSSAALPPDLTTPELTKLFEEAKKSAGGSSSGSSKPDKGSSSSSSSDASHTPPPESQVNTPLPLYIEPSDEVPLSKVTLRYKPFGAPQYKSVEMKKMGKGYGVEVPCEDVNTTGELKYFFAFTGADNEAAGNLGSNKEPFKVMIKNEIEGSAPKLPGKSAPQKCAEKGDCPPGLPGCEDKKGKGGPRGDKGWGASCEATQECKEGYMCLNGTCEEDKGGDGGGGGDKGAKKRMNLVMAGVQFDFLNVGGAQNVCDGSNVSYECFLSGTSHQFFGVPEAFKNTDGISGGGAFADVRIMAGYERQILKNIGLTIGVRLGASVMGSPSPDNLDSNGNVPKGKNQNILPAKSYLPFHGEARISYYILNSMMERLAPRPYVFVGGGLAQVNAAVPVVVCDKQGTGKSGGCPTGSVATAVDAYQITGLNFIGLGAGSTFGITPLFGIYAELKVMFMLPTFGVVISPNIGPVFNF